MKFSVITVCLNSEKTIRKTLESIKNQTFQDFEHLIIDGVSSDSTLQIVNEYNHAKKVISEKDEGIYFAMNKGLQNASGDILCFLNADDFYADSEVLKNVAELFEKSKAEIVYGDLQYISETGKILRFWRSSDFEIKMLQKGWMPPHPTVFFKRSVYEKFGGFDTSFTIAADYDWILRVFKQNNLTSYLPKGLVNMTIGGESNRSLKNIFKKSSEDLRVIKKNKVGNIFTLFLKNFTKISQFYRRKK